MDEHDEDDLSEDEEFLNSEDEYYSPNEDNDLDEQYFDTQDVQEYHAEEYENQGPQINTAEKWENQIDEAFKTAHIIVDIMQNTEDENDLVHKIVDILMEKYSNKLSMKAREGWKYVLVDSTSRIQTVLE